MKFIQARNFTMGRLQPVTMVVIHTAECGESASAAENVAAWGASQNAPKASWNYMVDSDSVTQSVAETDTAWHAGPVNGFAIGVEHAGFAKQTSLEWADDYSVSMLELSAQLVAGICRRHGIAIQRLTADDLKNGKRNGICGHIDVTNAFTDGKGHWDPGPNFPWDSYLERVRFHLEGTAYEPPPPDDRPEGWVSVTCDGVEWYVAPLYIHPMGIGAAEDYARAYGCELPSPALVDAIWRNADLKIDGASMVRTDHDGTLRTMASAATMNAQAERIQQATKDHGFRLAAGYCKDVVAHNGTVGLYGWHRLDGTVIQPFYAGHARGWIDYSQGLRLVRRA